MSRGRWKSPEDDEKLKRLKKQELYIYEIVEIMGFSAPTLYTKMRELEITNNSKIGRAPGPDRRLIKRNASIIADLKNGMCPKQAAEKYNITTARISQIMKGK